MSGSESNSSDNEFWKSLENPTITEKPKIKPLNQTSNFVNLRMTEKERYERTILNIRDSKEEEIRNLEIQILNRSRKELFLKIGEIKEEFLKENEKLKETYANSRSIIQKKDKKIAELSRIVIVQEGLISDLRILSRKLKVGEKNKKIVRKSSLKVEGSEYKLQVKVLKELCEQFKSDVDKFQEENNRLIEENKGLAKAYQVILDRMDNYSNEIVDRLKSEKAEIENEYARYKLGSEKEVEVREVLNKRHMETIHKLQDELKLAKAVLNSPRIHNKVLDKIKDLNLTREEQTLSPPRERNQSTNNKLYKIKGKLPKQFTYKEYKAFDSDHLRQELYGLRSFSRNSHLELTGQRSANFTNYIESRKKLKKDSILYLKEPINSK